MRDRLEELCRSGAGQGWLIEGLTNMPDQDIRLIANFLVLPVHTVQAVVWLTEMRDAERSPSARTATPDGNAEAARFDGSGA